VGLVDDLGRRANEWRDPVVFGRLSASATTLFKSSCFSVHFEIVLNSSVELRYTQTRLAIVETLRERLILITRTKPQQHTRGSVPRKGDFW